MADESCQPNLVVQQSLGLKWSYFWQKSEEGEIFEAVVQLSKCQSKDEWMSESELQTCKAACRLEQINVGLPPKGSFLFLSEGRAEE